MNVDLPTSTSSCHLRLLHSLINDPRFADVKILVGEEETVFHAHASIIALNCDYYMALLSSDLSFKEKGDAGFRATIKHEDVEPRVMSYILCFLYLGNVNIPQDLVFDVMEVCCSLFVCLHHIKKAADRLLIPKLFQLCMDLIGNTLICPENCVRLYSLISERKGFFKRAIYTADLMFSNLTAALQNGRDYLSQFTYQQVDHLVHFLQRNRSVIDRWRFITYWIVCKNIRPGQNPDILPDQINNTYLDLERAREDMLRFTVYPLFDFSLSNYQNFILPFFPLMSEELCERLRTCYASVDRVQSSLSSADPKISLTNLKTLEFDEEEYECNYRVGREWKPTVFNIEPWSQIGASPNV